LCLTSVSPSKNWREGLRYFFHSIVVSERNISPWIPYAWCLSGGEV
jgi:hypothetical protein